MSYFDKYKKLSEKLLRIKDKISGYDKEIYSKTFRLPNGIIENFFVEKGGDSVQIVPVTEDGQVVTVEQFRPGLEKVSLELPGGGIEDGESPWDAAERELREETGYEGDITFLGKGTHSPYSTGIRHMFVADNCHKVEGLELDSNEFLRVVKWPLRRFRELIQSGEVRGSDCAYMGLDHLRML